MNGAALQEGNQSIGLNELLSLARNFGIIPGLVSMMDVARIFRAVNLTADDDDSSSTLCFPYVASRPMHLPRNPATHVYACYYACCYAWPKSRHGQRLVL